MDPNMDRQYEDVPLAESNVTLKLADIQRRCSQLLAEPDELAELSLEEPLAGADSGNPYARG